MSSAATLYLNRDGPLLTLADAMRATAEAAEQATSQSLSSGSAYFYAAEISWGLIAGQLRGRIPYPVPLDLLAVATAVAIRWTSVLADSGTVRIEGGAVIDTKANGWQGFNLSELTTLWRYRVRTA